MHLKHPFYNSDPDKDKRLINLSKRYVRPDLWTVIINATLPFEDVGAR